MASPFSEYRNDAQTLFNTALNAAQVSANFVGENLGDNFTKHLSTLTSIARQGAHAIVNSGINRAATDFVQDAQRHFARMAPGIKPSEAGVETAHDVLPSLLTPQGLKEVQQNYDEINETGELTGDLGGNRHTVQISDIEPTARTHTRGSHFVVPSEFFHKSVSSVSLYGDADSAPITDQISHWQRFINTGRDYAGFEQHRSTLSTLPQDVIKTTKSMADSPGSRRPLVQHAAESQMVNSLKQAKSFIDSLGNLSPEQQEQLHSHFQSQLRHHYVAAVANPTMFANYNQAKTQQESEARARQQSRDRAESGQGSGRSRRGEWPHAQQPHEILGLSPGATREEIRNAVRRLAIKHHPDLGGDPTQMVMVNQASERMMQQLKEQVIRLADWMSRRF